MNKGLYFYRCNVSSTSDHQVFRYRYLETQNKDASTFEHPYFLMISRDAITFYKDAKQTTKLFRLPLYAHGTALDKLTEAIKGLCSENPICFEDEDENENIILKVNNQIEVYNPFIFHNHEENDSFLPYWVVFQHFLYDLSFSDLFQNATHFEEAITKLTDNYFIKCILAKGEYLYWLNQYDKENVQKFILERLWEADQNWINLIMNESHNRILEVSNNWFNGAETEMQKVLGIHFELDDKQKANIFKKYKEYSKDFRNNKRVEYLRDLSNKIEKKDYDEEQNYKKNKVKEIKIQRDNIYHFFLMRFSTWSLEKYIIKYNKITASLSLLIPIGICLIFIYLLIPNYIEFSCSLLVVVIFALFFLNFIYALIFKKLSFKLRSSKYNIFQIISAIFLFSCLGFISYNFNNLIKYFVNFIHTDSLIWVLIIFSILGLYQVFIRPFCFLISGTCLTAFGTIKNVGTYFNYSIGYPLMSIAIVTIWLGYIPINEEAWFVNRNFDNGYFLFYLSTFTIVILISIYYFVNDVMYGEGFFRGIRRSLALYLKGMSISIVVGIVTMKVSKDHYFNNPSDFFPEDSKVVIINNLDSLKNNLEYEKSIHTVNEKLKSECLRKDISFLKNTINFYKIKLNKETDTDNVNCVINEINKVNLALKDKIIDDHLEESNKNNRVPSILYVKIFGDNRYIFPKLLLMYASFAFFIGLFAQVAFRGSNYKENL